MTDAIAIKLNSVVKRYGSFTALDGVDLTVPAGTMFGFLGPNGAGKTTALRILIGMLRCSSGNATVLGLDPWKNRVQLHERVGYLPSGMGFYEHMTGRNLLDYTATLMHGTARSSPLRSELVDVLKLSDVVLDRSLNSYSKGMRQKLAIAQALQHDPELLLLDEPSEGLDPLVQHSFAEYLRQRRDAGRTIFFSSHTLSEVQALCDHVAIIREGKIVASSTYEQMLEHHPRVVTITMYEDAPIDTSLLGSDWTEIERDMNDIVLHTTAEPMDIVRTLSRLRFSDVTIEMPSLEDVFLSYYRNDDVLAASR